MAFQERRNRKRIRLPTPCGDGPSQPSGIRNSADKRSTSAPFRLHGIDVDVDAVRIALIGLVAIEPDAADAAHQR
jgi:hypothetical protein